MTHDEIIDAWNKQADYMNKWNYLGEDEKLEWAMKLEREAVIKEKHMKPTAWYDPSNGHVSTDRDCPLFTPLGQVWALYPRREWVDLTDKEIKHIYSSHGGQSYTRGIWNFARYVETKLKEKNT